MKKIFAILPLLALVCLTACKKEESVIFTNPAALDAMGVYSGYWTIISSDASFGKDGRLDSIDGTLAIDTISGCTTDGTLRYSAKITITRGQLPDDASTWTKSATANIAHAQSEVVFNNDLATNSLGSPFMGRTSNNLHDVVINCAFTDKIPDPAHPGKKKNVVNSYVFYGTKQ